MRLSVNIVTIANALEKDTEKKLHPSFLNKKKKKESSLND